MRRIRYLATMALLLCSITMLAQVGSGYNPGSPGEPNAPNIPRYSQLTLVADPVGGGNPTTSGKTVVGSKVDLRANKLTGFRFVNWTNVLGEVLSTNENFQITKAEEDEVITAHYVYEPGAPAEPNDPWLQLKVQLNVAAAEGGTVSGGGKYVPGTSVTLNASPAGSYVFKHWQNEQGEIISTTPQFAYTVKNVVEKLTAYFTFVPASPGEPAAPDMTPKHRVNLVATEGGTVGASQYVKEGTNVGITASTNSGYKFTGWYKDDLLYNTNTNFTYTVGTEDVTFEARFAYAPTSPTEPSIPASAKQYVFYIENANGFVAEEMNTSVFLTSLNTIGNMTFQISFPDGLVPEESAISYSDRLSSYTKSCTKVSETEYKFEFTGGEMQAGNGVLVTFAIMVPADYPTGLRYPVKMNQISFVAGGSSTTAVARNASLGVFKRGDVTADNIIDIADVHAIQLYLRSMIEESEGFIVEAADVDSNGSIDHEDYMLIVRTTLNNDNIPTPVLSENAISADPILTVAGINEADSASFAINMTNAVDVWGVQFDLELPEGMSIHGIANNSDRLGKPDDFSVIHMNLEDGWQRVFITPTMVERFINGFEGELLRIYFTTSPTMAEGNHVIAMRNVNLALQGLAVDRPMPSDITMTVHRHVDADNDEICDECGERMTYTRPMVPGNYGTLCLERGGTISGATCYTIAGKRVNQEGVPTSIVLTEQTEVVAGIPYIVLASADELVVTCRGKTISDPTKENGLVGSFIGMDVAEGLYVLYDNKVLKCGTGCNINAYHAFIDMDEVPIYNDDPGNAKILVISDTTTGITEIIQTGHPTKAYNIAGQRVPLTHQGIIIVNGKKIINK